MIELVSLPPTSQPAQLAAANATPVQVEQVSEQTATVSPSSPAIAPPESIAQPDRSMSAGVMVSQAVPVQPADVQMAATPSELPMSASSAASETTSPVASSISTAPKVDREIVFEQSTVQPEAVQAETVQAESVPSAPVPSVAIPSASLQPTSSVSGGAVSAPETASVPAIALRSTTLTTSASADAIAARKRVIEQRFAEIMRQKRQQQAAEELRNPIRTAMKYAEAGQFEQARSIALSAQLTPAQQADLLTQIKTLEGSKAILPPENKVVNLDTITALPYDVKVLAILRAIVVRESSSNYRAVNPHSGALGYGQIMPELLRPWSLEAVGRAVSKSEFLNDPGLQLHIIAHRLNQYWQKSLASSNGDEAIAVRKVASLWYSGRANLFNSYTPQYYNGHRYPSIGEYTMNVLRRYQLEKQSLGATS